MKVKGRTYFIEETIKYVESVREQFVCFGPQYITKSYKCNNCEKRKVTKKDPPHILYAHSRRRKYDYATSRYVLTKRKTMTAFIGIFCSKECENMFILAVS